MSRAVKKLPTFIQNYIAENREETMKISELASQPDQHNFPKHIWVRQATDEAL